MNEVVDNYVQMVDELCRDHNAHAVLCLPIPRTETMFPDSSVKTAHFNTMLTHKVESIAHIATWKHRGVFKPSGLTMDNDGVHLNRLGTIKYFYSLRAAINMYSGRLQSGNFK